MFKRTLSCILVFILVDAPMLFAKQSDKEDVERIEDVKGRIAKIGTGEKARATIKLRDRSELSGFITSTSDDSFVLTDKKTGRPTTVAYSDVTHVKGRGLSTGAKIGIGAAAAGVVVIIILGKLFGEQ